MEERGQEGWPSQVGCPGLGIRGWNDMQGSSISCHGVQMGQMNQTGCEVLRPGCLGRQSVITYPHKERGSCDFFINNFLWAQRCPQTQYHPIGLSHLLCGPAAASKPGPFFGCGGTRQLALASSLLYPLSQRDAWSAAPFCWPGPEDCRHPQCKAVGGPG